MIESPIFIVGTGRCGSTLLHNLLAAHRAAAWPSNLLDRYPSKAHIHRACTHALDVWPIGFIFQKLLRPSEAYRYWDTLFQGFRRPIRDLGMHDVTPRVRRQVSAGLERLLSSRRRRILIKITGWPRLGFLRSLFPDARFIHLIRDGRAVANSLLNSDFWWGWRGPEHWRWGPLTDSYQREWIESGRSFVVLAGIQWKLLTDAVDGSRAEFGESLLEVRYEDLCADRKGVIEAVCRHCGLDFSREVRRLLDEVWIESANSKWRRDLDESQQEILTRSLADKLVEYGYELAGG